MVDRGVVAGVEGTAGDEGRGDLEIEGWQLLADRDRVRGEDLLRAYPNTPACWSVMMAQAK